MTVSGKPRNSRLLKSAVVFLAIVNMLLIAQNRRLKADWTDAPGARDTIAVDLLPLPEGPARRTRLVFFLSPQCGFCARQTASWKELLRLTADQTTPILLLPEGDLRDEERFLRDAGLDTLPRIHASVAQLARARLTDTPATLVINQDGTLTHYWPGAWTREDVSAIASAFQIDDLGAAQLTAFVTTRNTDPSQPIDKENSQ